MSQDCAACGVTLRGRYCHACGQDAEAQPRPLREWLSEAFSEANLVDGRTSRTLVALALRPGRLLEAYRAGAGTRYQGLTKLFVVMTALFLLTLNGTNVTLYQFVARPIDPSQPVTARADPDGMTVHLTNVEERALWLMPEEDTGVHPAVTAAIQDAAAAAATELDRQNLLLENSINAEQATIARRLTEWLPNTVWGLLPMYALLLAPIFGRRRLFMEHLIFAMWAHVTGFALLILLALANGRGANLPALLVLAPYLTYVTAAAARYYGLSWPQALWRAVLHLAAYVVFALIPMALVIELSATDWDAYMAYLRA